LLQLPPRRLSMCTYATVKTELVGSAKGAGGTGSKWFHVTDGTVYFDHPVHAMADHTLNIVFSNPSLGPGARVAVELTATRAPGPSDGLEKSMLSVWSAIAWTG